MLIQPELSSTTVQTGTPSIAAVASSCIVCRKSPSPAHGDHLGVRLRELRADGGGQGEAHLLKPPEVMCVRGCRVTQRCFTMPCGRPAPVTTIASSRVAACTSRTARAIVIGEASDPDFTSTCACHAARSVSISSP